MESSNRRLTLFEQMSAVDDGRNALAGLTLDAILGNAKRPEPPPTQNRTLLDIIREDGPTKDKKSWKTFRDKLRLKRAGAAWTSSVHIPASDVNVHGNRSHFSRRGSFASNSADSTRVEDGGERAPVSDPTVVNSRLQLARRSSVRFGNNLFQTDHDDSADVSMPSDAPPSRSFRPQIARHRSTRFPSSNTASYDDDNSSEDNSPEARDGTHRLGAALAEERALSAREAVAAQEAAEAAAAAAAAEQAAVENNEAPTVAAEEPVRMSLMDLLEETGSRYTMGDDDDDYDEEEEEEEEEGEEEVAAASGGIEYTCCVCMVRHKGAAFIPCGHTFCRLCSRELWVQRGNCPLCNGFILEILDIF
ncbi:PREDICTED: uncharacterized protein LOC18612772 [Theobroma cacao]|uniref:Uncharacterized protein LOC18612772 n=1 Tax=Theobroma cacao TaxID=3641 RepID=A0AB32VPV1_THECC|nr:PREDICTED: uncharacterized protein LOC18612772 [Theobroma cacao]